MPRRTFSKQTPSSASADTVEIDQALVLLGGLTPAQFMRRHWQKKPLLVRQAVPGFTPILSRQQLVDLAGREDVESRLVVQTRWSSNAQVGHGASLEGAPRKRKAAASTGSTEPGWRLSHGPLAKGAFPPVSQPGWTLLVQGVDLYSDAAHALMRQFRFVPDARLDDLMISWASDQGGVGPHFDSYDVFLLQAAGTRRWRIGRQKHPELQEGVPLKILTNFEPEEEHLLEPGDMLYLPPGWAHDGVAEGSGCMTYSIGFRVPQRASLVQELVMRMSEGYEDETLYRDAGQPAVAHSAEIPVSLGDFARDALERMVREPDALASALGEVMTEPKPKVWFDEPEEAWRLSAVRLDRRTRMMYDDRHIYINGDSYRAGGADARLMQVLANNRGLTATQMRKASAAALGLMEQWFEDGWLHLDDPQG